MNLVQDQKVFTVIGQANYQLGAECVVRRNDDVAPRDVPSLGVDGVLISPGPGTPEEAGCSIALVHWAADHDVPLLGVCLGHQAIGAAYGGTVDRAPELLHGKTSQVTHLGVGVLDGLPDPFTATRYHSLAIEPASMPNELEATGWTTESRVIMAIRHREAPIEGVQFHPESVLTQGGHLMLANWLASCGDDSALSKAPALAAEVERRRLAAIGG